MGADPINDWPHDPLERDKTVPEPGEGHGWIQWKGTGVCMDVYCRCGAHGHIDAGFAYFYRCAACGVTFSVGATVRLYALTPEAAQRHGERALTDEACCLRWSGKPCDCYECGGERGAP